MYSGDGDKLYLSPSSQVLGGIINGGVELIRGGVEGCGLMRQSCHSHCLADMVVGGVRLIIPIRQPPETATSSISHCQPPCP